jgi:hypothetical protein
LFGQTGDRALAEIGREKLGTKGEFDLRDDDRASDTGYRRAGKGRSGFATIFVIGLLVAGAILGYGAFHRGEPGATESTSAATVSR